MKELCIKLGGFSLGLSSPLDLKVGEELVPFLTSRTPELRLEVRPQAPIPVQEGPEIGEDLLLHYFQEGEDTIAQSGGRFGPVSSARLRPGAPDLQLLVNDRDYPGVFLDWGKALQLFPLRRPLLERGAFFLHASQAALGDLGVLFTAPSGTGKTTQAHLWRDVLWARLVCNDRAVLRREEDGWRGWSFPVDGDEPAPPGGSARVAAVVLLEQAPEERLERLRPAAALPGILSQSIADPWDPASMTRLKLLCAELTARVPVYRLACRPVPEAALLLRERLRKDGAMP